MYQGFRGSYISKPHKRSGKRVYLVVMSPQGESLNFVQELAQPGAAV